MELEFIMKTIRNYFVLILVFFISVNAFSDENISKVEKKRRAQNKKYDRFKLREKNDFVSDRSEKFLIEPKDKRAEGEFSVAKVPPTVKFMIPPDMEPAYFPDGVAYGDGGASFWANWAYVTRSEDNRFYFSMGDPRRQINIYEYYPDRDVVHRVFDVGELLGWAKYTYTDGKIHGHMGIMPDGTLWAATHFGVYPDSSWWANGYRGSWLISYNIYTHEAKNWGIPLVGNMLPCFSVDTKRGRLAGTGANYTFLCWDCINKKVRYAGYPPNGWIWQRRAMLCDEETGKFWSFDDIDEAKRFLSFDSEYNKFERYEVSPPKNPFTDKMSILRGHTDRPAMDGWYYWSTHDGAFFRFKPEGRDGPVVELIGVTWGRGADVLQMGLDPSGRYIYYKATQGPVIQYDVKTGRKKVLCWLQDYYFEKYGYWTGKNYGLEISNDGSFLFFCTNGGFRDPENGWGNPSVFVVFIPEEERPLD